MRPTVVISALSLTAVIATAARAQSPAGPEAVPLERVDPGLGDAGPLATSLRDVSGGLQVPTGFEHVYRVPGSPDRYMRVQGGLYAVFPRSRYTATGFGPLATIPDGTVFHIGAPWAHAVGPDASGHAPVTDRRERVLATAEATLAPVPEGDPVPSRPPIGRGATARADADPPPIVADPAYRAKRLRDLLRRAADAAAKRRPSG